MNTIFDKKNRLKFFYDNYYILTKRDPSNNKKVILGKNEIMRKCRFCGKDSDSTTFHKDAHSLPHLIGNEYIFSYYECDLCNDYFSKHLENHFAGFLGGSRSIMGIRGKRGVPIYKKNNSLIKSDNKELIINSFSDNSIVEKDDINKTLTLKLIKDSYIPLAAYKMMLKMFLSVISEDEIGNLQWAIDTLFSNDFAFKPCHIYCNFTPGLQYERLGYLVFKRIFENNNQVPEYIFIVCFGNLTLQIILPAVQNCNENKNISFHIFPALFDEHPLFGKASYGSFDCSSNQIKKGEVQIINFQYDELIEHQI